MSSGGLGWQEDGERLRQNERQREKEEYELGGRHKLKATRWNESSAWKHIYRSEILQNKRIGYKCEGYKGN